MKTPSNWRDIVVQKLAEWGPIEKATFVLRLAPLMPPGFAWHRHLIDDKVLRKLDIEDEHDLPQPTSADLEKAQRALVLTYLRNLRGDGRLEEQGTMVALAEKRYVMPLHTSPDGVPARAGYPPILGPERKGGKVKSKLAITPTVTDFDDADDLRRMFAEIEPLLYKLYGNDRIARRDVQSVINWMNVVSIRLGLGLTYTCDARKFGGRWTKKPVVSTLVGDEDNEDEAMLARQVVGAGEKWYKNDHGTHADHQTIVNAVTLSFRL